jgi:hypothetical protein
MPIIYLEFDESKVSREDAESLANAFQQIVKAETRIEDVVVYGNDSLIKVAAHPLELFVQMSAHKIQDANDLLDRLSSRLATWKDSFDLAHKINLTLDPKPWKINIGM